MLITIFSFLIGAFFYFQKNESPPNLTGKILNLPHLGEKLKVQAVNKTVDSKHICTSHPCDLIIFSFDGPMQLYALLESTYKYVQNLGEITVIYRTSSSKFSEGYRRVKTEFNRVKFLEQGKEPQKDFKPLVLEVLAHSLTQHIAFIVDDMIVKDFIDLKKCSEVMQKTKAYGFYLRLGNHLNYCYMRDTPQKVPPLTKLEEEVFAWQFGASEGDWKYPNNVDFTIYNKESIIKRLKKMDFHNPKTLELVWEERGNTKNKTGLCFATSKVVNIPLNLVEPSSNRCMGSYSKEELLSYFLEGLKIDIAPLHQIKNQSAHLEYPITFTKEFLDD